MGAARSVIPLEKSYQSEDFVRIIRCWRILFTPEHLGKDFLGFLRTKL